jgi:hypothetical protein
MGNIKSSIPNKEFVQVLSNISIYNVGLAYQNYISKFDYLCPFLNVLEFESVFFICIKKKICTQFFMELTKFGNHFNDNDKTTNIDGNNAKVSALEMFTLLYLLCDNHAVSLEQKLDAIISVFQFQEIPNVLDPLFTYNKPHESVSRDTLFVAFECTAVVLCKFCKIECFQQSVITSIIDNLFEIDNISALWSNINRRIQMNSDIIYFLRKFMDCIHFPTLFTQNKESLNSIRDLFFENANPYNKNFSLAGRKYNNDKLISDKDKIERISLLQKEQIVVAKENMIATSHLLKSTLLLKVSHCMDILTKLFPASAIPSWDIEEEVNLLRLLSKVTTNGNLTVDQFLMVAGDIIAFNSIEQLSHAQDKQIYENHLLTLLILSGELNDNKESSDRVNLEKLINSKKSKNKVIELNQKEILNPGLIVSRSMWLEYRYDALISNKTPINDDKLRKLFLSLDKNNKKFLDYIQIGELVKLRLNQFVKKSVTALTPSSQTLVNEHISFIINDVIEECDPNSIGAIFWEDLSDYQKLLNINLLKLKVYIEDLNNS